MANYADLKKMALDYGVELLTKRLETLKARKFVIAPWLRIAILNRRIQKLKALLD